VLWLLEVEGTGKDSICLEHHELEQA